MLPLIIAGGCATYTTTVEPVPRPDELVLREILAADVSAKTCLTAASYNLNRLADRERIRADLAARGDVDIWCFQEMPFDEHAFDGEGTGARSLLEGLLPSGRWYTVTIRVNRLSESISNAWEAQVIASRYPMDGIEVWELDASGPKRRAALIARLAVAGRTLLVVNTDHEPSFLACRNGNARQAAQLRSRLVLAPEQHVLVAGDFNCSGRLLGGYGNSAHIQRLDRMFADAGMVAVDLDKATFRAWPLSLRLDRIYVRGLEVIQSKVDNTCSGSDHLPVWCRVQLP